MSYCINSARQKTMLARVGDAAELIDNIGYLPFYRSVQIKLVKLGKPDEWAKMIAIAKTKSAPNRYFAKLCKMVRDGTYKFVEAVKEVVAHTAAFIGEKIAKFGFGTYQKYWIRKVNEFINLNSMAGFIELLEYADRKGISQKYFARAIINGKRPAKYYTENVIGGAK